MVRLKSRYLVASFAFKDGKLFSSSIKSTSTLLEPASEAALLQPLRAALAASAGDLGAAASGPGGGLSVRAFDPSSGVAVIRCPRSLVPMLRVAMTTSMPSIAHRALRGGGARTLRVCGSSAAARRAAGKLVRCSPLLSLSLSSSSSSSSSNPPSRGKKKSSNSNNSNDKLRAAVLRVREEALRRIAAFDA